MTDPIRMIRDGLLLIIGVWLVGATLLSAIQTVVVPRSTGTRLTHTHFRLVYLLFQFRLRFAKTYEDRDRIMALYSPITMTSLPLVWVAFIMLGYTLLFWVIGDHSWESAYRQSGSSLLTLGFAPVETFPETILAFTEAALGLGIVALLISYLPTLYSSYSRREANVTMLEIRAGSPPSAVELINRAYRITQLSRLQLLWAQWETWFTEVEESHTSFTALCFFRSPQPERSWITAAGVILDSAALMQSVVNVPNEPQASLCIRAGFICLRHIADQFNVSYNPKPDTSEPISIARAEFDAACAEMEAQGVPLKEDREQAWKDFSGWRVNYDVVLLALAEITMAPYTNWVSDRGLRTNKGHWRLKLETLLVRKGAVT